MATWYADLAWLGNRRGLEAGVVLAAEDGVFTHIDAGVAQPPPHATRLAGVTVPGFANAHSHCFQRALRGRAQTHSTHPWAWRELMHTVATRLDPDTYYALARAVFAEMTLAGITCVGEFHHLHHQVDGTPYDDPNIMGGVLVDAASEAGLRITLFDAYYPAGDDTSPRGPRRRFADRDADVWAQRVSTIDFAEYPLARLGAAFESVRVVAPEQIPTVHAWAREHEAPLHLHLSAQRLENEACRKTYDRSPTELLVDLDVLGPGVTGVGLTHVSDRDIALLGASGTGACVSPTSARDLADGIAPAHTLHATGSPLSLGTDSHASVDMLEEARGVEHHERLRTQRRVHWPASDLLRAATRTGYEALGWRGGTLSVGAPADFVTLDTTAARWAGLRPENGVEFVVFTGTAGDVREVVVGGASVVSGGKHQLVEDVRHDLDVAIESVLVGR